MGIGLGTDKYFGALHLQIIGCASPTANRQRPTANGQRPTAYRSPPTVKLFPGETTKELPAPTCS